MDVGACKTCHRIMFLNKDGICRLCLMKEEGNEKG